MAKIIKITNKNGKELSLEELVEEIRAVAADVMPEPEPEPTQERELTPEELEELNILNKLFGHVDPKDEPKAPEQESKPEKSIEERIDDLFKEAEKEIPVVKAHAKKAALVTGAVVAATGALLAVSIKHALSDHK